MPGYAGSNFISEGSISGQHIWGYMVEVNRYPRINVQSAQSDRVIGNTRGTAGKARSAIIKGTGAADKQILILIILLADGYSFFQIRFYK